MVVANSREPRRKDEAELAVIRKRFGSACDAEDENRRNYVADLSFSVSADQWDEETKRKRGRGRPALTFNRLNGVIKQIIGDYRQNKLSIKVLPADGDASEESAELIAGLIRNIEAQSNADLAYTTAFETALRGGFGYWRVAAEYTGDDTFDQDLVIKPITNPLTVYFDPAARLPTRADAGWCFVTEFMNKEAFQKAYPKAPIRPFDDTADWSKDWFRGEDVRVAEYFAKERYAARLAAFDNGLVVDVESDDEIYALERIGVRLVREREAERTKIVWKKLSGQTVLDTREYKARYLPVIRVAGEEVDVEGKLLTRSAIFYAKDAQRNLNYWKSTATEAVALTPKAKTLLTPEQIQGHQQAWDNAHTSPTPYLLYNNEGGATPQPLPTAQPPIGELTMAGNASDDIKATTGIYDASLGARSNETSGRAIVARQQEGANATYLFLDNLKGAIEHCGRVLIDYIPTVYDAERVVRVLDLEGNPKTETINRQEFDRLTGVTRVLNSITVGKYDVVVTAGPSFANRKAEMVSGMAQLVQAYPPLMQVAGDLLLKNMDWPGASEIAERVKRTIPPALTEDQEGPEAQAAQAQQQAMQQQQAEQAMQLQQGKIDAENAKSQATVAKAQADVVKAQADTVKARTEAVQTVAGASQPAAQPQPVSQPTQPPIAIQFNAEEPMNRVAATMEEFVVNQAEATGQVMDVIKGVMQATAQSTALLAESLARQQQVEQQQAELLRKIGQANAAAMQSVAGAIHTQTEIMKAPRVAVRDKQGNIVASEIRAGG